MIINSKNTSFFNQPELHFSSDKSSWEEEKLGSNILLTTGKLDANASNENGNYAFFTCNKETLKTDTYAFDCDAILINGNGDLGFTRKYSGKFNAYQRTYVLTNFKHNFAYLEEVIKKYLPKKVSQEAFGGAMPYIRANTITDLDIYTPSMKIQEKVSCLLSNIEEKIKKQEILLNKLKNTKASLLIKMFPQNNEDIPELRFAGFTDTWEQRKLGEIYKFKYGEFNNNPSNGGEFPVFGANGIIGGYTKYNSEDAVIIGHMGEYAGSVLWGKGKHFVTYNGTISKPKVNFINSKFGYYVLYQKNINKICAGSGLPFLSYEQLNQIEIYYPNNIIEQIKISKFFTNIDSLITLHQHKPFHLNFSL